MIELALMENYIFEGLESIAAPYGFKVLRSSFDAPTETSGQDAYVTGEPIPLSPVLYFKNVTSTDRRFQGFGGNARMMTSALYEIGVWHDFKTYGGVFNTVYNTGTYVSLLSLLSQIDDKFDKYAVPVQISASNGYGTTISGWIDSCGRESPVPTLPEPDGVHVRDGGLYRIHARKA